MLPEELVPFADIMKEGQEVTILMHAETEMPLTAELPTTVDLVVTYTEPGLRGDTATNTLKPATVETGARIQVPLFVDVDTKIRIKTSDYSYVERVK